MLRSRLISTGCVLFLVLSSTVQGQSNRLDKVKKQKIPGYTIKTIEGFTVLLSDETMENESTSKDKYKPLKVLEREFQNLIKIVPAKIIRVLRKVPVWVEWDSKKEMENGRSGNAFGVYYGGSWRGMLGRGENPLKAKCVVILQMKLLTRISQKDNSSNSLLMHELAHAVHLELLGSNNSLIKAAYKQAMERRLYPARMYATTNEMEFFAELTCAYYNQLDQFPRTRSQLEKHDPVSYKVLANIWGKDKNDPGGDTTTVNKGDPNLSLEKLALGSAIQGKLPPLSELKGKPVAVLLWNMNRSDSMTSFPKIVDWDAELRYFGLKTIALHLVSTRGEDPQDAIPPEAKNLIVTKKRWTNLDPIRSFNEFPMCLVFDHEGKCIFKGSAFEAEESMNKAVGIALANVLGDTEPTEKLEPAIKALRQGKSLSVVLPAIARLARNSDDDTKKQANQILDNAMVEGKRILKDIAATYRNDPVDAFERLKPIAKVYEGTEVSKTAIRYLKQLQSRSKAVQTELRAQKYFTLVDKIAAELRSQAGSFNPKDPNFRAKNRGLLLQLQQAIQRLRKAYPDSRATKEAERIGEKYGVTVQ